MKKTLYVTLCLFCALAVIFLSGCPSPSGKPETTKYTVTFETTGADAIAPLIITAGDKVTKPNNPVKTGFVFGGWFTTNTFETEWNFDTDTVTSNKTLHANWVAETAPFTVTFSTDKGTQVPPQTLTAGNKVTKPPTPTNNPQKFGGWFTTTDYKKPWNFASDTVTESVTLHALWVNDIFYVENAAISVKSNTAADGHIYIPAELDGTAITAIEVSAFYQKTLTAVTIPFGVTEIGTNAFQKCAGLASVSLPSSLTSIGANAFTQCALTDVTIPASVTTIGGLAFGHNVKESNPSLTTVTVLSEFPPKIGSDTFSFANASLKFYVPKGCKNNYTNAGGASQGWGSTYSAKIDDTL